MLPTKPLVRNGFTVRPDEHQAILKQCRTCIVSAFADRMNLPHLPKFAGWGWRYHWRVVKRDRDGSLLVRILVYDASGERCRTQQYRLVDRQHLLSRLR